MNQICTACAILTVNFGKINQQRLTKCVQWPCTSARAHVCVCVRDLMRSITVCEAQLAAAQSRKQVQTWLLDVQGD